MFSLSEMPQLWQVGRLNQLPQAPQANRSFCPGKCLLACMILWRRSSGRSLSSVVSCRG